MNNGMSSNLINDNYSEPAAKKPRISHFSQQKKKDPNEGMMRPSYDSRDVPAFVNPRSREEDYYG
jgi:hypothetical protein